MSLSKEEVRRYARHIILPEVGGRGQLKLKQGSVAMAGLGAIASVAGLYLAAAGVGSLHLQALPHDNAAGAWWPCGGEVAALQEANPATKVTMGSVAGQSLVLLTGGDLADALPLAGDLQAGGSTVVLTWQLVVGGGVTVLPAYGSLPAANAALGPAAPPLAAVAAPAAGVLGSLAATEAIKQILGLGEALIGRALIYEQATGRFVEHLLS